MHAATHRAAADLRRTAASVLRARPSVDLATADAAPRPPLHAVCAHLAATFMNSEDSRRWYPLTPAGKLDGDGPDAAAFVESFDELFDDGIPV